MLAAARTRARAGLFTNSLGVAVLFLATKGIGFLRDPLVAGLYGASARSDSYYVALGIGYLAYAIVIGGMAASVIPVFVSRRAERGDASAWSFVGAFLCWVGALFLVTGLALFAGADRLLDLLSPGLGVPAHRLAATMLRIFAVLPLLAAVSTTLSSALNCYDRFLLPATVPLGGSVASVVLLLVLTPRLGVVGAAVAFVVGTGLQAGALGWIAWRHARRFHPTLNLADHDLPRTIRLGVPGMAAEALINVNYLVILYLRTSLGPGIFSSLQYGNKVQQVFLDVFIAAVGVVMFPSLARSAARGDMRDLADLHSLNLQLVTIVLVPIATLVIMLRLPLIELVYQRRAFDLEATRHTATALGLVALSLVPLGIKDAATKAFYSLHDSLTPLRVIALAVAVNLVLDFVLVRPLGGGGLMLAYSIAAIVMAGVLLAHLSRRGVLRFDGALRRSLANVALATAAMGTTVWAVGALAHWRGEYAWGVVLVHVVCEVVAAGAVYVGALLALGERDVEALLRPGVRRAR